MIGKGERKVFFCLAGAGSFFPFSFLLSRRDLLDPGKSVQGLLIPGTTRPDKNLATLDTTEYTIRSRH